MRINHTSSCFALLCAVGLLCGCDDGPKDREIIAVIETRLEGRMPGQFVSTPLAHHQLEGCYDVLLDELEVLATGHQLGTQEVGFEWPVRLHIRGTCADSVAVYEPQERSQRPNTSGTSLPSETPLATGSRDDVDQWPATEEPVGRYSFGRGRGRRRVTAWKDTTLAFDLRLELRVRQNEFGEWIIDRVTSRRFGD